MKKKQFILFCLLGLLGLFMLKPAFSQSDAPGCPLIDYPFELNTYEGISPLEVYVDTAAINTSTLNVWYMFHPEEIPDNTLDHSTQILSSTEKMTVYDVRRVWNADTLPNCGEEFDRLQVIVYNQEQNTPELRVTACDNMTVYIDILNIGDLPFDNYHFDFGDGNTATETAVNLQNNPMEYTYSIPVDRTITVTGYFNTTDDGVEATTSVRPMDGQIEDRDILSDLNVTRVDKTEGSIDLNIALTNDISEDVRFFLEIAQDNSTNYTFDRIEITDPNQALTINGLDTKDHFYCFRIVAYNPCNDAYEPLEKEICSAIFTQYEADAENYSIELAWQTELPGDTRLELIREDVSPSLNTPGSNQYTDFDIECERLYRYSLYTYDNLDNLVGTTEGDTIRAKSTAEPDAIEQGFASIEGTTVSLAWDVPTDFTAEMYFVERSKDGGPFELITETTQPFYEDPGLQTSDVRYCYRVYYRDECLNESDVSPEICPVLLQGETFIPEGRESLVTPPYGELSWTLFRGSLNQATDYSILRFDKEGSLIDENPVGMNDRYTDNMIGEEINGSINQLITYQVKVVVDGNPLFSNKITLDYTVEPFFPNAFSPNGDNLNDYFRPSGLFIAQVKINIFNRWGELIYYELIEDLKDDQVGWDGKIKGSPAQRGTYIYEAELTDLEGNTYRRKGAISIVH